ncbi:hypothetical protein [Saccharicrinis sp. FJH54]|uniref:hypothetical protein n=1 Tax=Saccharicrinis sp. FJH54 TaxID=3344665 RepID=UPI0035D492C8
MINKLIPFLLIISFIGCNEIKEKVAKIVIDSSKLSNITVYDYKFENEKIKSEIAKTYTLMFGQIIDSMIVQTNYKFNDKGLLIKETSKADFEEKPSFHIYDYDLKDSLILEIRINQDGDTTTWDEYAYFPDGRKTIFHRDIFPHFDPNQDIMTAMENPKMDTSFYRNEFEYKNNLCISQKRYNNEGRLLKTIIFEYDNNKLIKENHLTYFNSIELTEKIKFYDYSKSKTKPDYYSIDSNNDTLEFKINTFDPDKLTKIAYMNDYGNVYNEEYYEDGLLIGTIDYDKQFTMNKIIFIYEYDRNGILTTEKTYREKINAH